MKKLLSILLLCFCFFATAQNISTIQQLLDEGVTVGELLDAGISHNELYGKEIGGGLIFDFDTINGAHMCKVVSSFTTPSMKIASEENNLASFNNTVSGLQNTETLASLFDYSIFDYAVNANIEGYSDWYIPEANEAFKIAERYYYQKFRNSEGVNQIEFSGNYIVTSTKYISDADNVNLRHVYVSSTSLPSIGNTYLYTDRKPILVRYFDVNASLSLSTNIQQLLDEGVTIGELLDAGISHNELYGKEIGGGLIFDFDTINGAHMCKVVSSFTTPSMKIASEENNLASFNNTVSGLQNTETLASLFNYSIFDYAVNANIEGYGDWYIPEVNEAFKIGERYYYQKFRNHDGVNQIEFGGNYIPTSTKDLNDADNLTLYHIYVSSTSLPSTGIDYLYTDRKPILVRCFDVDSTPTPGSPALQSFLETYTPPVSEEEIVSNANSFDVLNPLSYNGEFEAIHFELTTNSNYIVPSGKTLVINQSYSYQTPTVYINDIKVANFDATNSTDRGSQMVLTLSSGDILSISASNPNAKVYVHGLLLNKVIPTIHFELTTNSNYEVPSGKTLIINQSFSYQTPAVFINDVRVAAFDATNSTDRVLQQMLVSGSGDIISISASNINAKVYVHGILIDNSNYTYATDYELIDALNEGMDSLSTMSEMVVLENDSISSQNAILSQENEALMAIDYNFDSLQYVADFLSSQVFELQQELLVPNIDVDMAIGWNMVGFSCPQQKNAEDALINIVDEVIIFKDNSGNVYMPEFSFNGIGDLTPGHGYQLKVTDYILDFNICE